jgi:alpha-tubulin suppressor-like RCC1 family protein
LGYIDEEDETPPSWQPGLSAATNTVRIVGVTYTGSDTFLFINGTDYNAGKQNAGSGTEPLRIGAGHVSGGTSYQQSKVDFAEMLVYDRELSTDERTQLENYLNLRYNVFTNKLAAPRITPIGGDFTSAISVTVTSSVAGATYLVSMTGTGWSNYTGPITVTNSTTVFAQTTKSGEPWSDVTAQHFNFCLISNQAIPTNGLKLRLLADSGVVFDGDYVSRWRDQSGNTNDVTQLAIAYQPRYVTNSMNGKPAIRFDGANDWMDSLLTIPTNTFPTVTVYTVERIRATPGGYRSVWGVDGTTGNWQRGRGFWADDDPEREFVVQMGERGGDLEDNIWRPGLDAGVDAIRVVGLTYTPTNTFAFVNAASYTEGGHAFSNSMEYFRIGAGYIGGQNCAVDFSEILVYDHKLTDPERTQLESSLSLKYITDSDNDGLPDAWEVVHFGNITSYSGYNDPDGDWITNTQEYENGSNPMDTMVVAWGGNYLGQTDVPLGLREVVAVAGGYDFSLALRTDGRVSVWGGNEYGQTNPPSDLTNAVAIAAGFQHALALRQNGRVVQWGYSDYFSEAVPTNLVDAKAIAAGFAFSLALRSNGTLVAWGGPSNYAVIALPTNLTTVKAIAAAECHGLALLSNGTVVGWGIDPIIVPTNLTGVAAIATGFMHGLILRSNGTVMAFGDNSYNQTNMPVGLSDIAAIAAGELHSVVLRSNGTLVSWGDSTFGATNVPAGLSGVIGIGAGFAHNLAIRSGVLTPLILQQPSDQAAVAGSNVTFTAKAVGLAGVRYQWRFNAVDDIPGATNATLMLNNVQAEDEGYYRVFISTGAGTVISSSATFTLITPPTIMSLTQPDRQWLKYPAPVDLTLNVTATAPAEWASTLTYQWKLDGTNIVGGATSSNYSVTSFDSPEERQYSVAVANAAGTTNSTTLKLRSFRQGGVAAWGANESGQLNRPWAASNVISVAGGASHSLLLREDGTLLGWGDSSYGQTNVPAGITNVTSIAAGANHNLALLSDSTVLAWGRNNSDQTNVPAGLTNVVGVAAGGDQSFALLNNGTVTNWGASNAPMPSGLTNIMAIAVGTNFSLALRSNGTVVAWGNNGNGQTNVPSGLSNVVAIAGGGAHALALRQNGTVVAWGLNSAGQTNAPADLTNAMAVAGGYLHSVALRNDGTVVVWGDNSSGQTNVGNGLTGVKSVAAGGYHSLAAVFSPLVQYTVDVSKDVLLIYNTNSVDSSNVCAYYIQHRPMITGANVLPIGTHPQETVSRETFTNTIRNPILAWLDANPTKRPQYWVMFLDIPTRLNAFTNQIDTNYYVLGESVRDNSVSYELHANTTPIRPFITYINMADTNVCRGYIDKLESFGSNYSPAKLIISAHAGTYNNMNYYFDDAFGYVGPYRPGTNAMLGVIAAGAAQSNVVYVGASTHISYGTNVAGYLTWGGNAGQGGDYPTNGSVVFTGESGWWIIETVESYNGQRFRLNQGTFMRWFAANAFGGANFANTPAGAVCHVDEPGYSDVNDASLYFAYWHLSHRFAHCAWNSRQTPFFLAVGDPLITR